MAFNSRDEFINAQTSEKITLATVEGRARLFEWTVHSGSIYKKTVPYYAVDMYEEKTQMLEVTELGSVIEGTWYYDPKTSILYAHFNLSANPTDFDAIVTYRFFYASGPVTASHNLANDGIDVPYDGRILSSPGYKHKVGIEQRLTSIVGSGNLKLENNDAALDEIFDTIIFENQRVLIYSFNRQLDYSDARIIFRGRITNKTYSSNTVSFTVKDSIFDLEQSLPQEVYSDSDNVNDDIKGRYKRWIYGRVDGLKLQSIDQIGDGYQISGTGSMDAGSNILTGSGTSFLNDCSPGDTVTLGTQEFDVEAVNSDTEIETSDTSEFTFTSFDITLSPEIPTIVKNRDYFVAGHACSELTKLVVNVIQLNRIELSDTIGLESGDFLEFASGERKEIKNVAPGNIVVLRSNIIIQPTVSSEVIRQPVQKLFLEGGSINADSFTITNTSTDCTISLDSMVEFDQARTITVGIDMTFTNGTRDVTTVEDVDLRETFRPRDWIRPENITYTTFYEILSVDKQSMELRVVFADATITDNTEAKFPEYISDTTTISAETLGRTEDGEVDGVWIETAAQAVRDILDEINITSGEINASSFTDAQSDAKQTLSLALPLNETGGAVQAKKAIDLINKSIFGSLTLDNDLKLKYKILQADVPLDPITIKDEDVVKWTIKTVNGQNFRDVVIKYRHKDVDRTSLERGSSVVTFTNDFVDKYIGTSKLQEFDVYLFKQSQAEIMSHRYTYFNRLGRADIAIESDLRYEDLEIGEVVVIDFERLYKRFGDSTTRKKLAIIVGKQVDGSKTKFQLTDLGNIYNTTAVIAPNTTNDYSAATTDEKLKYGYITNSQGIVDDNEDTSNINLIT